MDNDKYPEIAILRTFFNKIAVYKGWPIGSDFAPRKPQPADLRKDYLLDDASNLASVFNYLENQPGNIKGQMLEILQKIYPFLENITYEYFNAFAWLQFHEKYIKSPIPTIRQSDGVLRFLCLLAILMNPTPAPVTCIEEPEIGLHPDAIRILGELLKEASKRTQLFITTHSDLLVSSLTDMPESVVICDRGKNGTRMKRLKSGELEKFLEDYNSLGQLWLQGELGGVL